MDFNFTSLKEKLSENELEIVYAYVGRNREKIIRGLTELNEQIVIIPIKEVPTVNGTHIEDINDTFSLRKEDEVIFVDLVE